jgi:hypothetical protein
MLLAGRQGYNQNSFIFEQFTLDHLLTPNLHQPFAEFLSPADKITKPPQSTPKLALAADRAVGFAPICVIRRPLHVPLG